MATETLRPNGNSQTECYNSDNKQYNNYTYVDETSTNDSDYIYGLSPQWNTDLYTIPAHSIPAGATINKVTFYARFWSSYGSDLCKFAYKSGGTVYYSSAPDVSNYAAEFSWEQTTNQYTSAAWTRDEITNLLIGVSLNNTGGKTPEKGFCTQLWIVVDYTEAANTIPIFMNYYQNIMR